MQLHHIALEVNNLERSIEFYQMLFGQLEEIRLRIIDEEIVFLSKGNIRIELIKKDGTHSFTENIHICFEVDHLASFRTVLSRAGITVLEGPFRLENGWETLFIKGPDGEVLEFLEL
ncbi:VOC family protein [Peribacillus sp. SCS-155]|uniref:VOC family protein n=1 Tax=Peribacillus sedimenti TaxID=3115297 RepID=UPI0039059FDD